MEEKLKIFFCEDDENLGMLLREYLQAKGYVTDLFSDGEAGYKGFTKGKYDLCVLDVMMPKKDGRLSDQTVQHGRVVVAYRGYFAPRERQEDERYTLLQIG